MAVTNYPRDLKLDISTRFTLRMLGGRVFNATYPNELAMNPLTINEIYGGPLHLVVDHMRNLLPTAYREATTGATAYPGHLNEIEPEASILSNLNALHAIVVASNASIRDIMSTKDSDWRHLFAAQPNQLEQASRALTSTNIITLYLFRRTESRREIKAFFEIFLHTFGTNTMQQLYVAPSQGVGAITGPNASVLQTAIKLGILRCHHLWPYRGEWPRETGYTGNAKCCNTTANPNTCGPGEPNDYCETVGNYCTAASDPCE